MNEARAIFRAVRLDPVDDAPRLIYADWLEEHASRDETRLLAEGIRYYVREVPDILFELGPGRALYYPPVPVPSRFTVVPLYSWGANSTWKARRAFVEEWNCNLISFWFCHKKAFTVQPIMRVVLMDKSPLIAVNHRASVTERLEWHWCPAGMGGPNRLPSDLYQLVCRHAIEVTDTHAAFPSEEAARDALSFACVDRARRSVGLPLLYEERHI